MTESEQTCPLCGPKRFDSTVCPYGDGEPACPTCKRTKREALLWQKYGQSPPTECPSVLSFSPGTFTTGDRVTVTYSAGDRTELPTRLRMWVNNTPNDYVISKREDDDYPAFINLPAIEIPAGTRHVSFQDMSGQAAPHLYMLKEDGAHATAVNTPFLAAQVAPKEPELRRPPSAKEAPTNASHHAFAPTGPSRFQPNENINSKVAKCAALLETKGIVVPTRIADIRGLPVNEFGQLCEELRDHRLLLQRLSSLRVSWIEEAVTEPHDRRGVLPIGAAVTAVGAMALAIGVSLWFLLFLIFVPVQYMAYARRLSANYDRKVMRAAVASEPAFCMLYRVGQINLTTPDYRTAWYWTGD